MSFRPASVELTKSIPLDVKQENGIFFTPKEARDRVFELLKKHSVRPTSILEPSFGSGEFFYDLRERYPRAKLMGVEKNPTLASSVGLPNALCMDFFAHKGKYSLIVGNPPYFVIPKTEETEECQSNRPNIFVQFLYKAIRENLTPKGYLAFVLPTSLYNCAYYEKMRRFLYETTTVLEIEELPGHYMDTQQKTFVLLLQNGKQNDNFFLPVHNSLYINPHYKELRELLKGSKTLDELGFDVKTGEVVWNQVKDDLSDSGTLVIYSSNFSTGVFKEGVKPPKKQYIQNFPRTPMSGKSILINRGYGNSKFTGQFVLVDFPSYYAENHVNVIRPRNPTAEEHIKSIMSSLNSEKTKKFIEMFVGKGGFSKTEVQYCLPIWLD